MAIMLISWICTSVVFCLVILGAAACPAPRMEEEMTSGSNIGFQREVAAVPQNARLGSQPSKGALPSACQAA